MISNKVCSNDIYIYESESDTITVKEYSEFKLTEDEISTVKVNNGRLEVAGKRKNQIGYYRGPFSFTGGKFYTELWLPESYHGEISLETVSGDIIAEPAINLAKDFKAQSMSGDISLPVLTAKIFQYPVQADISKQRQSMQTITVPMGRFVSQRPVGISI